MKKRIAILFISAFFLLTGIRMAQLAHKYPEKTITEYCYNKKETNKKYGTLGYIKNIAIPDQQGQEKFDFSEDMLAIQIDIKPTDYRLELYRLMINNYVNSWNPKSSHKVEDGYIRLTFPMMKKDILSKKDIFLSLDEVKGNTLPVLVISRDQVN